jgi:hypothetical protein
MRSLRPYWLRLALGFWGATAILLIPGRHGFAQIKAIDIDKEMVLQQVIAASVVDNPTPAAGDTIAVAINVDISALIAPNNRLGAYQASLQWNPAVLQFLNFAPGPGLFGAPERIVVRADGVGMLDTLEWNDFLAGGDPGPNINLINFNFKVVGAGGSSDTLDLEFSEMFTSTFRDLRGILKTNDGVVNVESANNPPVLNAIADQTMDEGATLNVSIVATDPNGNKLALAANNLPAFGSLTDNGNGTGTIRFAPGFDAAGVYPNITVIATDDGLPAMSDTVAFALTVRNVNRAPVLGAIANQIMNEGATLNVSVSATDPDGNGITLAANNLPVFGTFTDNGNGTGAIRFTPGLGAAGVYPNITVVATDNGLPALSDTTTFTLTVRGANRAPVLGAIANQIMNEGATLNVSVSATDPDGNGITLAANNLPAFGTFTDNGNGTGAIRFAPGFDAAGIYPNIAVVATDNGTPALSDTAIFTLAVNNVNRAPTMDANVISDQLMDEGTTLRIPVIAVDPDNDRIAFTTINLPAFGSLADSGNGKGTITFAPGFDAAGVYPDIQVVATDNGTPALSDTIKFTLTVRNVNRAPSFPAIVADQTMREGDTLRVAISAIDPDGDRISLVVNRLPLFGSFVDGGNGTGAITFTPGFNAAGTYPNIEVVATDNGIPNLSSSFTFDLTVIDVTLQLVCKVEIVNPKNGTITCGATSIAVCIKAQASGGVGPITKACEVNGIAVQDSCVALPLAGGNNPIIAKCTFTDAVGTTCVSFDTISVFANVLKSKLTIASPLDSAFTCSSKINVSGTFSLTGGIGSIDTVCTINGSTVSTSGGSFGGTVALTEGLNTIIAACTFTDSVGCTTISSDAIRVIRGRDDVLPQCKFTKSRGLVTGTIFDNESGVASIEILYRFNARFTIDPFTPGAKTVNFRIDAYKPDEVIGFDIKITDVCGNVFICDPVLLTLSTDDLARQYAFNFRNTDRYMRVINHGLTEIRVDLNGSRFGLFADPNRADRSMQVYSMPAEGGVAIDLLPYLQDGENSMFVVFDGPPGASAEFFLVDQIQRVDYILETLPLAYQLLQNYPNPFNPSTKIEYSIPAHRSEGVNVQIRIFNALGELVRTLVSEKKSPGRYVAEWDGRNENGVFVASGVYIYQLVAGEFRQVKRMTMVK